MIACLLTGCNQFDEPGANYSYQPPVAAANEFTISSLQAEEMDPALITQVTDLIVREKYKRVDGLLILRNNKLVYENYFHGYSEDVLHNIFSAGKSITSILTGIAIDKGFIDSVRIPVMRLLPEYASVENPDPRKKDITVEDLLNMRSGLACDDWYQSTESQMQQSRDWVKFTLDLPMVNPPGVTGSYCTGCAVTLGRIIEHQSGLSIQEFANRYLFEPLGITAYQWHVMPDGKASAGGLFFIRPRDMAKIGLLMLNNGVYNGEQVVSGEWVNSSRNTVLEMEGPFEGYGYLWWKQSFDKGVTSFFADGNGGQHIFIVPSRELVVIFTSGNKNTSVGLQNFEIMNKYILPATE
jgi:CubicO group peptidase (beta-lactamase class C family)